MSTPRERRESTQVDFSPEEQACAVCQHALKERDHKQRWIMRLDQHMKVVNHFLECGNTTCTQPAVVYRPQQEDALAWRGYTVGLDVVARIGEWRDRHNLAITKIRDQLQTESQRSISLPEVAWLCEVFWALVTTVAHQEAELIGPLRTLDGLILAIDGGQPETSHETLYIVRDVRSGRIWVAKTRLSSAPPEIELLSEEVLGWGLPIAGVISEKQASIGWAVQPKLPPVPQQMCPLHDVKEVAQPVCAADRHVKKELKKPRRGISALEPPAENSPSKEAQVVADDGLAIRTVMRDDGKYALEPPGVKLYQKWPRMAASVARVRAV